MRNNKRFTIDVSEDENGVVDVSLSTHQDFNTILDYDQLVRTLKGVFDLKKAV